ncbi:MAG TPA: tetratricopeptide repeat protein [Pyrinomonadaceae bacterium]|nr:tetratricopeptide repeat protein [Pyrinomonadaceae bacterium]
MKFSISLLLTLVLIFQSVPSRASQAKGSWRSIRTNNLFVIGNTDAETLHQVALWLEFFHGAFARLVSRSTLDASVPTTVILFRDDASFVPFKPLYQGRPLNLAGYFQPGDDVNYIAITIDPADRNTYSTAFHEYVHLYLKDGLPNAPLWLNEGLAELYGTLQFSRGEALLGAPITHYAYLLRSQELLPLTTLFAIDYRSPHYNEQEKTGLFYAQSWALVHYLMMSADGGRQQQFKQFLQNISRGDTSERAIEQAFGTNTTALERDFAEYVRRGQFPAQRVASADPQAATAYAATQRSLLSEGEANFYLGDLLQHINRANDAEAYFKQAIAVEPTFIPPYASLGEMYAYQKRYADAKKYLQRAVTAATTQQQHMIHYLYAFVLSREGMSPTGWVNDYSAENLAAMREQLQQAIKLAPEFAPAYYLLAFVDFVAEEKLDEAVAMARKARELAPTRASYSLLLAQIYLRLGNTREASSLAEPLTRNSDSAIRRAAQEVLDSLSGTSAVARSRNTSGANNAIAPEPIDSRSSRIIVGGTGSTAIRDGQTIEESDSLPALDEVLARYVEAMGGAEAIRAVTSRVMKGSVDVVGVSRGGSFEISAQAPNKMLSVMNAHPYGLIKMGYNGRIGWQAAEGRVRLAQGTELDAWQRDSDLHYQLNLKKNLKQAALLGKSKIGFREVYVLELQPRSGNAEKLYLDAETYLPVRMNVFRMGPQAGVPAAAQTAVPVEIYYDDWRAVDGVKYPFRIGQTSRMSNGQNVTLSFNVMEIRHNVPVSASLFDPPVK